tara:strand:- start:1292 stop:1495 length:204 start_codon:yes stop_codon:yes gene_type:complete
MKLVYRNRYEVRANGIWDKKEKEIIWNAKSKAENESVCKNLNNGSGFKGNIPSFFNKNNSLQEGLTS